VGLRNLRRMILAVRDLPGVEILPVRALNERFAPGTGPITWADVRRLAQAVVESETIRADDPLASPTLTGTSAQTLDVLARAVLHHPNGCKLADGGEVLAHLPLRDVLGPVEVPPPLERPVTVPAGLGLALCRELIRHVDATGHLPTALIADGTPIGPGPLLRAVAAVFLDLDHGQAPTRMTFTPGAEGPAIAASLAEDAIYRRLPGWSPHAPDLRLDLLALHTRLQSWSLKPAVLAQPFWRSAQVDRPFDPTKDE
jgi:hypothetical protein